MPRRAKGKYISLSSINDIEKAADIIINKRYPEVCLNDAWDSEDFDNAVLILNKEFEQVYSEKCEYEL